MNIILNIHSRTYDSVYFINEYYFGYSFSWIFKRSGAWQNTFTHIKSK